MESVPTETLVIVTALFVRDVGNYEIANDRLWYVLCRY